MRFRDHIRLDEKTGPHKPRRTNVSYELGVTGATGTMAGSQIQGKADIISRLRPIVGRTFRDLRKQGLHPQDIEEMLLDSIRLAILYSDPEGAIAVSGKPKMSTTEFIRRSAEKHDEFKSDAEFDDLGQR